MKTQKASALLSVLLTLTFVLSACGAFAVQPTSTPVPTDTDTPMPTATITPTPTNTPRPSPTPRPTKTPNLAATQRMDGFNAETKSYFDEGYIKTANGKINELDDFDYDWAQLGWYKRWTFDDSAADFYISAHLKWSSAYRNAETSGCGFVFAVQDNGDHYAVFLDRAKILFLDADHRAEYSKRVNVTNGTGRVKFDNPADHPIEADFTVIVNNIYAYVLVDGDLVGTYLLSQFRDLNGKIGLSVLSGTNKDFGTRCEMTNIHIWTPNE